MITNLGECFRLFFEETRRGPSANLESLWARHVEQSNAVLYSELVWAERSDPQWKANRQSALSSFLPKAIRQGDLILTEFDRFESILDSQIERYRGHFPDFSITVPVYALPTSGKFNGRVGTVGEGNVLAFGLDTIVDNKDPPSVLYSHELFHIYHVAVLGNSDEWDRIARLTWPLWLEGLATYASGLLNPGLASKDYLLDADLAKLGIHELADLASRFLHEADVNPWAVTGFEAYSKWFLFESRKIRAGLPNRVGYALALEVVRRIARTHALTGMIKWQVDEVHRRVVRVLQDIAED